MLKLVNVSKSYSAPGDMPAEKVLDNISLELSGGQTLAVVGPSGSGKTTLLNIIGSLDKPDCGQVLFNGTNITTYNEKQQAQYRCNNVGIVFQEHNLLGQCTVLENMLLPVLAAGPVSDAKQQRAHDLLDQVGLADRASYFPGQLSGGQCQRVAIARAFINQPDLLLADEPTGALDRTNAENVVELICQLCSTQGSAGIVVTHDMMVANHMNHRFEL